MTQVADLILRDYQDEDLKAIEEAFNEYRSVMYQLPTGGGKSIVVTKFIHDNKKKNILVLSHKRRLLTQMRGHLQRAGMKVGLMIASLAEDMNSNIVIASIRTAVKSHRLEYLLNLKKWDYIIIDEARHTRTGSYDSVLESFEEQHPMCKLLGVDATPFRKDKKRLDKHFQYLVTSKEDVASLTAKGYLQKCKVIVSPIDKDSLREQVKEYTGDYQQVQLSEYMRQEKYINYVVDQYKNYGEGRQAIVFAVDIAHAKALKEAFINKEVEVGLIYSELDDDEIDKVYRWYEEGKIQVLINVEMATEGVDLPSTGCIIGARPTKSLTLYLQMAGRGTRPDGVHDYFILLDCCGWTDEFGTIASPKNWSLDPDIDPNNPRQKNKIVGKRKDGTYTEDLTNFIGEVVEMTPDEYIVHLQGGLEKAANVNKSIEDKVNEMLKEIVKAIMEILKADNTFIFDIDDRHGEYRINWTLPKYLNGRKISDLNSSEVATMWLKEKKALYVTVEQPSSWGTRTAEDIEKYLTLSAFTGTINKGLLDPVKKEKLERSINGFIKQAKDLIKQKIDLDKYKEAAEKVKEEQWRKCVEEHLQTCTTLNFKKFLREDQYFKAGTDDIMGIIIPSGKINSYHNKITLITKWKSYNYEKRVHEYKGAEQHVEKNYVAGDKVWEIIKKGEWAKE